MKLLNKILLIPPIIIILFSGSTVFGAVSVFEPRFTISEEYTDNLYLSKDDKVDDFVTVVTPGFNCSIRGQRSGISADYEIGHSFYNDHSENDDFRHNGEIYSWHDFSRYTRLQLSDSFEKTEEPLSESGGDSGRRTRDSYFSNSAGFELVHRFGERRNVTIDYYFDILNNDDDLVEDNSSHNSSLEMIYYFDTHTGLETEVDYTKGIYDISSGFDEWIIESRFVKEHSRFFSTHVGYSHTFMDYEDGRQQDDYQVYHPFAGAGYIWEEDASASLTVGYYVQDIENRSNNSGITIEALIGKAWTFRRGEISIETTSGYEESYLNSDNLGFNVYGEINGRSVYNLSRDIAVWADLSFRNDEFVNPSPGEPERHDKSTTSSMGVDWRVKQWMSLSAEYGYNSLNSNISEYDYKENRFLLSVNLSHLYKDNSED